MLFEPNNLPFLSVLEHHAEPTSWKRTVPGSLKLSRFEPTILAHLDYDVWGVMLEKHH